MPDEAILGGLLRMLGSIVAEVAGFLLKSVFGSIGRVAIYILTLGRIDVGSSTRDEINWLSAVAGFLATGGIIWIGRQFFP